MRGYLFQRLLQLVLVLLGVSTMMFVLLRLSGDPVTLFVGDNATAEEIAQMRRLLGFDDPLPLQYGRFLRDLAIGEFGQSFQARVPARDLVLQRLPATLELTAMSLLIGGLLALPAGVLAALRRGSIFDTVLTILSALGQSLPTFLLGILLILLFAVNWHLLPTSGRGDLRHLLLPGLTLGLFFMARIARVTRSSVLDVMTKEYVTTARAKGLPERLVVTRHLLRNALLSVVTVVGHLLATVVSGAIVTETVFAWPGLGTLMVQSVQVRDYPVVQASVFVVAVFVALTNLATDIAYTYLDPRVRLR